jgi:ATP-binding cassette subfamily B protein/subfamily B ATP-binding cassette protein MsbA
MMRNFVRSLKYSWRYRYRLAASVVCALMVAALWSVNLTAVYPAITILGDKSLHQWVDERIDKLQGERNKPEREIELASWRAELKRLEANPAAADRENGIRRANHEVAKREGELTDLATSIYRYQLLKSQVIRLLPQDRFHQFLWLIAAVLAGVAVKGLFEFFHESLIGSVTNRTLFDLRNRFFRRAVHQDVRQLAAAGTPELMARVTNDTEQLGNGMKILYGRMVGEPLKAVGCLAVACYISWQLTLLFAVLVPLALATLMKVSKMMRRAARRMLERMSTIYKIVREVFDSARTIKGFTRETRERRRFRAATEDFYHKAMRVIYIDAFTNPMIEFLGVAAVSLALVAGAYLVIREQTHILGMRMAERPIELAALLQFYVFLGAIADPIRKMSSVYTKLQTAEAAAKRIFEVYDRAPTITPNADGPRVTGVSKKVEFRNVCFSYDPAAESPTLANIHLTVRAGETVAFVGPNGCGKTTLVSLLPRFLDPDSGAVLIDGVNLRTAHLRSLRRQIGIVTQDTQLFDDTVLANIAYGKKGATREDVVAAAKKAHAHGFIERLVDGYETGIGERGERLSGGQRQRVALARAMLRDPALLILDEFTSAIDPESESEIHAALKEFVKPPPPPADPVLPPVAGAIITPGAVAAEPTAPVESVVKGRTTFLITHRLNTLEIADRIVVMDAGRIADVGTHGELLARCETYHRLFESAQFRKAA